MYDKLKLIFPRLLCVVDGRTEDSADEEENGNDNELSDNNVFCTLQNVQQIICKKKLLMHEFEECVLTEKNMLFALLRTSILRGKYN